MRLIVLLIAVSFASALVVAQVVSDGDTAYLENDYPKAIAAYEALLAEGSESGALYYNLGQAYSQLDDLANALLNYRRAALLLPRDADVRAQINRIRVERTDAIGDETDWLNRADQFIDQWVTSSELHIISFGIWGMFWLFVILRRLRPQSDLLQLIHWGLGVLLMTLGIALAVRSYSAIYRSPAIIMVPQIPVLSGPGGDYLPLYDLHAAAELRIVAARDGWVRFQLADGRGGWLPESAVQRVSISSDE